MNKSQQSILAYRVSGNGYPVVFLHGFLESSTMWTSYSSNRIQKICVDLPGHGNSKDVGICSMEKMAGLVQDVINSNGIDEYVVVGHSMGGYVGLEVLKSDSRCKHLILLNSNFWADSPEKKNDRKRVAAIVMKKKDAFIYEAIPNLFYNPLKFDSEVKNLIREALEIRSEAIAACSLEMMNRNNNSNVVHKNKERVTIIQGVDDSIVNVSRMNEEAEMLGIKINEVDSGHMAHIEAREQAYLLLENVFKKITETN